MSYTNNGIEYTTVTAYTNPQRTVFWQKPYTPQQYAAGYTSVYRPMNAPSAGQNTGGMYAGDQPAQAMTMIGLLGFLIALL